MNPKVILVGGTSHSGKSTLASALADRQSRDLLSTDRMARHPGRPWGQQLPGHVADYYQARDGATLANEVLRHYRENVWPIALAIVRARLNNPFDHLLVLEGSAVLPEQASALRSPDVQIIMMSAPHETLVERIRSSCGWEVLADREQAVVQSFIDRTIAFDRLMRDQARASGLQIESGGIDQVLSRIAGDQFDPSQVDRTAIDE